MLVFFAAKIGGDREFIHFYRLRKRSEVENRRALLCSFFSGHGIIKKLRPEALPKGGPDAALSWEAHTTTGLGKEG